MWGHVGAGGGIPAGMRGRASPPHLCELGNADRGGFALHLCPLVGIGVFEALPNCTPQHTACGSDTSMPRTQAAMACADLDWSARAFMQD